MSISTPVEGLPWQPAADVAQAGGVCMMLFGYPGAGKTTFGASAQRSPHGGPVLVVDADRGIKSLADEREVQVWPRKDVKPTWPGIESLSAELEARLPFRTVVWDSLTAMLRLARLYVSPPPRSPSLADFGKAGGLLQTLVETWVSLSQTEGVNVLFIAHAEEDKDETTGAITVRPQLSPKLRGEVGRLVDTQGFLSVNPKNGKRKLLLHETSRVLAKHRQPRTGPQLPLEIEDPTFAYLIDHHKRGSA